MADTSEELDRVDRKILKLLQERGRLSNVELSHQVNLSPAPCLARVKRLERRGFIRGYHADLDPKKLGLNLLAYVEVILSSSAPKTLDAFSGAIRAIPEIAECHMVSGRCDYLIKVGCADMEAYRRLLVDSIFVQQRGVADEYPAVPAETICDDRPIFEARPCRLWQVDLLLRQNRYS